ncbi:MAG: hypothetical protein ABIG60_02115 [Patescibacteria group bacterium]
MNYSKFVFFIFIIILSFILYKAPVYASENFNPNYIISDFEVLDYTSMNLDSIQLLLENKNSFLATYSCSDPDGKNMTAAEIIYDRAITNKISPKFLIVLLQKEQSLIEEDSPKESQLDWATGYGCPDGASCNPRWQGFWKQVNSASLQFRDYIDNPHLYTYKIGETYTFNNPYSTIKEETTIVTPLNQATAALYNYTPHVYNGNYNFYNIWQRYFTINYSNGSLLKAEGEVGVWLIQNNKKRPFLTKSALTSRFDENKIITVNKSDLDKYEKGAPIKFQNYSLLRSPRGTIFLLVDDSRRGFASAEAFRKIGYNPEEVMDASWEDINSYTEGQPITASSTYPTGALLQDKTTGGVYWVLEGKKAPIWDKIFLSAKYKNKTLTAVSPEELADYETISPVLFPDGELVKSSNSPAVYLISENKKRPFISGTVFEGLGYKWENIITISPKVLYLYEQGDYVTEPSF